MARSKEEREERKRLRDLKLEARRLAREKEAAAAKQSTEEQAAAAAAAEAKNSQKPKEPCLLLESVPEDSMHQIICCLPARELGAFSMTCRSVRAMLFDCRIPYIMSRLSRPQLKTPGGVGCIDMCSDEAGARTIIQQSYGGGDTGRLVVKRKAKKGDHVKYADEFVSFARFLQEAVSGFAPLNCGSKKSPVMTPPVVGGRFVSVSPEHSLVRIGGDGDKCGAGGSGVTSWGVGKRGQLGHGKRQDQEAPRRLVGGIGYGVRIVQVSAGGGLVRVAHSLLLTSMGRVLSFGTAQYGQLGHGYSSGKQLPDELRPRYIDALANVRCICVSAGELHSAAVTSDGDVYTWGDGFCGQLGLGDKRPQLMPRQIECGGLEDECVASVACGNRHTLCVTEEGEVFSFGLGYFGVLGRNFTPFEYDADAAVVALGGGEGVVLPPVLGDRDTLEAVENVLAMGENEVPPTAAVAAVEAVTGEAASSAAANSQNDGEDAPGRGGMSEETLAHIDLLANLTLDDSSDQCIPMIIDSLKGIHIVGASAGHRHSMLLADTGALYTFGSGVSGALGHGDLTSEAFPMKVMEFDDQGIKILNMSAGVDMSMAVTTTGDVYAWGKSDGGRIGLGVDSGNVSIPRRVAFAGSHKTQGSHFVKAVDVECGYVHSVIVALDGTIHQCGGVGTHGDDDGARDEDEADDGDIAGRPTQIPDLNIWHRLAEPKEIVKQEKWKKYGKYEFKGRKATLSEAERWNH